MTSSRLARVVGAVAVCLALFWIAPAWADDEGTEPEPERLTWGIAPSGPEGPTAAKPVFDLQLDPGDVVQDLVSVSNYGETDLALEVYAQDAFTTDTGGLDALPSTGESVGAGAWIQVVGRVTVPARSRVDVPFTLRVPPDAAPGDYAAAIMASTTQPATDSEGGQVLVDRRVGSRVYLRVNGDLTPGLAANISSATFGGGGSPVAMGDVEVTFRVSNHGNVRLGGTSVVTVVGPFGLQKVTVDGPDVHELLPGESFEGQVTVPGVAALGRIRAVVDIEPVAPASAGSPYQLRTASDEMHLWAIPWIPLLVLGAIALWLWLRHRRRARTARPEGQATPQPETSGDLTTQ